MEDKTSEKIVIVEEQLDGIDRDGTGNLEDLLKLVLINEEKLMVEKLLEILTKKKPDKREYISNKREYISNKYLEYCELVRYNFSCGSVINNLKEMQLFSD